MPLSLKDFSRPINLYTQLPVLHGSLSEDLFSAKKPGKKLCYLGNLRENKSDGKLFLKNKQVAYNHQIY